VLGWTTFAAAAVHALVWVMGWPWPYRFSASVVLLLTLAWAGSGLRGTGGWLRKLGFGLVTETGGRGLWTARSRRRVMEQLVRTGDPRLLVGPGTGLVIGALALDRGCVTHFVSWPDPSPEFRARVEQQLGEVRTLASPDEAVRAAIASSAIPGVFQPERIDGRDFVDAGGFSNQPLHVALANDADAIIVVLLTPSQSPTAVAATNDLFLLAGRMLELANWRDLQTELRSLPDGWTRDGSPARVCVVEPDRPLPGTVLGFDPEQAASLIDLGEIDAWRALERAGWVVRGGA
jgi:hypothetical protein